VCGNSDGGRLLGSSGPGGLISPQEGLIATDIRVVIRMPGPQGVVTNDHYSECRRDENTRCQLEICEHHHSHSAFHEYNRIIRDGCCCHSSCPIKLADSIIALTSDCGTEAAALHSESAVARPAAESVIPCRTRRARKCARARASRLATVPFGWPSC